MLLFWRPAALIRTAWRRLINSQGIHLQLNWSLCDANGSSAIPWSTPPQSSPCSIRLPVRGWSRRVRVSRGQSSTWCWRTYRTYFPFRCHHTQQFKQTHAYDWRQRRSVSKKNMFTSGSNNRCTYTYSLWWRKSRCEFPELFSIHPRLALLRNANFLLQVWVSRAQLFIEIALYSWGGKAPRLGLDNHLSAQKFSISQIGFHHILFDDHLLYIANSINDWWAGPMTDYYLAECGLEMKHRCKSATCPRMLRIRS